MDAVLLVMDEIVDGGCVCVVRVFTCPLSSLSVIMETDPGVLTQRIAVKVDDTEQSVKNVNSPIFRVPHL